MCLRPEFMFLSMVIPGPSNPRRNIDVCLRPLNDELTQLWSSGALTYDISRKHNFVMRAALIWTINDFPTYGMVSGLSTYGKLACLYCMENNKAFTLTNGGKASFLTVTVVSCHIIIGTERTEKICLLAELKRMLHPRVFPVKNCLMLCQSTVKLCLVSNQVSRSFLVLVWPIIGWSEVYFGSFLIGRPIFFAITLTSCTLKRTCLRTFSTPSWMWRGRLDVALFCNRKNLELVCDGSRVAKPRASFVLEKNAQLLVYKWLKSLCFPDGHASNISRLVNTEECRLYGMKSHDCHVFIQTLIPLAFHDLLPKGIWDALTEISHFFRDICSSKLNVDHI